MRLEGKIALITGAGGPMGAAIAFRFAREGATLALSDISAGRLAATVAGLGSANIFADRASATEEAEMERLLDGALARFGRIDIIVNVVGGVRFAGASRPLLESDLQAFRDTMEFNLAGIFLTARRLVPGMRERGHGRIVNISSVAMTGLANMAAYGAAKAAVASLTRTMAIEFAPEITVNAIAPSLINTGAVERMDRELINRYLDATLLRRIGEPEDIANAALFLASDEASFITGINLPVSGGMQTTL